MKTSNENLIKKKLKSFFNSIWPTQSSEKNERKIQIAMRVLPIIKKENTNRFPYIQKTDAICTKCATWKKITFFVNCYYVEQYILILHQNSCLYQCVGMAKKNSLRGKKGFSARGQFINQTE